jgi:SPP1 family predicted phage head-tail adaptor
MSIRGKLRAQSLDDRVAFERKTEIRTSSGGMTSTWAPVATVYARVDGAKASSPEPVAADGIRTQRDYTVWVRADVVKRFTLTPLDRVNWKGRLMNIADIPDHGLRGQVIAVICRAGLNGG